MHLSLLALASGIVVVGVAGPAAAAPGDQVASAPVVADGWYAVSPACAEAIPCAPLPSLTAYPVGTLHVGTAMTGAEEARSYLRLDLSRLPVGAQPTGGTLFLPIAPEADGTSSATTAALRVCLAAAAFDPSAEGAADPPEVDCAMSAPAVHDAAAGRFTVDLAPLAGVLATDDAHGLAIMPAAGTTTGWRIAMSSSTRPDSSTAPPSAELQFRLPAAPVTKPHAGSRTTVSGAVDTRAPQLTAAVAIAPVTPVVVQPQATPTPSATPPPAVVDPAPVFAPVETTNRFSYPAVFLVPIALLVGAGWAARAFTRDLTVGTASTA